MTAYLTSALIISLVCVAVHLVTRPGYLMDWVGTLSQYLPYYFVKPLYDCLLCMGGVWGLSGALLMGYRQPGELLLIMLLTLGMNGIISLIESIYELLQIIVRNSNTAS